MLRALRYDLLPPTEKQFLRRLTKAASVDVRSEDGIKRMSHLSSVGATNDVESSVC